MSRLSNGKRKEDYYTVLKRKSETKHRNRRRSRRPRSLRMEGLEGRSLLSANACFLPAAAEPNAPPDALDDVYVIASNQQLGSNVLANDLGSDGGALAAILVQSPEHGQLVMGEDGRFTYKPEPGFAGTDRFTYQAYDGLIEDSRVERTAAEDSAASGNEATVTIVVEDANHAPEATADSYTVLEDETLLVPAIGLLENDTDSDGDSLGAVLIDAPAHGTVILAADGSLQYMPNHDFNGTDTFTYAANDGQADSDPAMVTIDVQPTNDAPTATDDTYTTREDQPLVVPAGGVLENDWDVDADQLTELMHLAGLSQK